MEIVVQEVVRKKGAWKLDSKLLRYSVVDDTTWKWYTNLQPRFIGQ